MYAWVLFYEGPGSRAGAWGVVEFGSKIYGINLWRLGVEFWKSTFKFEHLVVLSEVRGVLGTPVFHPYERNPEQVRMPAPVGPFF